MFRPKLSLILIVIAGEAIFMAPFLIPRLYRPLMLEAWGINNTSLGTAFSTYGIVAMISYLVGGPFADKYHPRVLIASSLVLTALASLYLALLPSELSLIATYGFFGASTTLLMWGALIKTVHVVGSEERRSRTMGALDAGRGLSAALFSSLLVLIVTLTVPDLETAGSKIAALKIIYVCTASLLVVLAAAIWISLKAFRASSSVKATWDSSRALRTLKDPRVWWLSVVVLGSYCGYKGIDNYAGYLVDVHGMSLSESSKFTSLIFWLRPAGALAAGFIADRYQRDNPAGRFIVMIALLIFGGLTQLALTLIDFPAFSYMLAVVLTSAALAYALRAVYFSVFGDLNVPESLVGTVTGIVSFVGFLPDVFFGALTGRMIDGYPGAEGYRLAFAFTAACLFAGAGAAFLLYRKRKRIVGT